MSILDRIVAAKAEEVAALAARAAELRDAAESMPPARAFEAALQRESEVALIAEVKRRSPSAGWIRRDLAPADVARAYEAAGAAAVSVLTDADFFGGSLADLDEVRRTVSLPVLRKDFTIDPVQVWESRAAGADAILLIARILDDSQLRDLGALARELGMAVLVEIHGAAELDRALAAGATVVGVNNRDLSTFHTDLGIALGLAARVPAHCALVAESGIRGPADVARLGRAGVDAVLVGETLMRAADVGAATAELTGHASAPRGMPAAAEA